MNDMPLSQFEIYKKIISIYERYASTEIEYIKTLIRFLNDIPVSKFKIYKITNKFFTDMPLSKFKFFKKTNNFYERYVSIKIQNIQKH